jgi:hypothetical protein
MSVQLIVYPSGLTTTTTNITSGQTEFIVDGQNFSTMNSGATLSTGTFFTTPNTNAQGVEWADFAPAVIYGPISFGSSVCAGEYPFIANVWNIARVRVNIAANADISSPPPLPDGYLDYPTQSGSSLIFEAQQNGLTYEGLFGAVYQRLWGLTAGQQYTIIISDNIDVSKSCYPVVAIYPMSYANIWLHPWHNTSYVSGGAAGSGSTVSSTIFNGTGMEFTFTATHFSHIFWFGVGTNLSTVQDGLEITSISIMDAGSTTVSTTTTLSSNLQGQEMLDLYEDESIPLTLSVDDFKDVATKTQSYSKAFNLPATKKNNKVFGSLYEVTKQAGTGTFGFNPYARTPMTLKENGFIVFEGFLRLIDVIDKDGEISYNVNLYSETVAFMDVLKDKTFYDLPLCELDHDYDLDSIQASQTGVLPLTNQLQAGSFAGAAGATTTDVLKYPLVDWTGSMRREATTREIDLGATDGNPSMGRLEDGFRPFIKLKYLVDNIFADAGFTYDSAFFDSAYFSNLFMDFNWGEERDGSAPNRNDFCNRKSNNAASVTYLNASPSWANCPVSLGDTGAPGGAGNDELWQNSNYKFISDVNNLVVTGRYRNQVENRPFADPWWNVDSWTVRLRICVFDSNNSVLEVLDYEEFKDSDAICPGCERAISGTYETVLNNGDYIQMEAQVLSNDATSDVFFSDSTYSYLRMVYNNNAVGVCSLLQAARGELAQWDFFKGLTTMFNLITLQDPANPSNLLIEPYDDIFTVNPNIKTLDWTKKVDISDIKLKPLDLERRVVLQFEEDEEDYPFMQYKVASAGYLYGSGVVDIDGFDVFQGDKEVIASPFAATVFKNLFDDIFDFYAPVIYGSNEDQTEFGPIKNLPRILYDTGVYTISSTTFFIPAQNGEALSNETSYSLFSHTDVVPPTSADVDLSFSVSPYQLLDVNWVAPLQNLFTNYYFNYFSELYNTNVKSMNIKVLLTPEDIANFNFYDRILIKNREYRVDKINYKPNDLSTVEFILIT